jgi:cobalamin transport system substrate-binding protein
MRSTSMRLLVVAVALWLCLAIGPAAAEPPQRIVSLIPAVTEMIFATGRGARVVGVSDYDKYPPEVSGLTKVGGLLDPSVERILGLKPDLVVVYNTQVELKQRLERADIPYFSYQHRALADVTMTVRAIGARIGSIDRADTLAAQMERSIAAIRESVANLPHPRTMLVFERDASSLRNISASAGYGFLHDMLEAAGGEDLFGDIKRESVQATTEMILARKPDVIIELRYGANVVKDPAHELQTWNTLSSVPAVKNHRIYLLTGDEFVVPGPRVVDAIRRIAETLHPRTR